MNATPGLRLRVVVRAAAIAALICIPVSAWAQPKAAAPRKEPKWTFEVFGGGGFGDLSTGGGSANQFPAGETFTTEPGFASRSVPSWYFGDGAALFNEVNEQFQSRFGLQYPRIDALDDALRSGGLHRGAGASFGVRLARQLTSRFAIEFGLQRSQAKTTVSDDARAAIEASRASFESGFSGLFATMPQSGLQVTSTATLPTEESAGETAITGALKITLSRSGRLSTHATIGAGRLTKGGGAQEVRLRGNYQFRFLDTYPMAESDGVVIRFTEKESAAIGVFGGGLTYDVGARQAIRVELRVHASGSGVGTSVEASPNGSTSSPPLALPSNTNPTIQFSNHAAAKSSLSGRLPRTETFTGSGLDTRLHVTAGYVFRF